MLPPLSWPNSNKTVLLNLTNFRLLYRLCPFLTFSISSWNKSNYGVKMPFYWEISHHLTSLSQFWVTVSDNNTVYCNTAFIFNTDTDKCSFSFLHIDQQTVFKMCDASLYTIYFFWMCNCSCWWFCFSISQQMLDNSFTSRSLLDSHSRTCSDTQSSNIDVPYVCTPRTHLRSYAPPKQTLSTQFPCILI